MTIEILEDKIKRRLDMVTRGMQVKVYDYAMMVFKDRRAEDLKVGDIVMVQDDEAVPADLLLISS